MGPEVPGRERGFKLPHVSKGCLLQALQTQPGAPVLYCLPTSF